MTWLRNFNAGEGKETSAQKVEKPRLRRGEVPPYLLERHGLVVARSTLAKLASIGGGPRYQKVGRMVLYPIEELDHWSEEKLGPLRDSTSGL